MKILGLIFSILICGHVCIAQNRVIDNGRLDSLVQFTKDTHADGLLVVQGGDVIAEWDNDDCDSTHMNTASSVKSWTNILIGRLINEEMINSLDDPVCLYVPAWKSGCSAGVTIRHLMTMTSGLLKRRGTEGPNRAIFAEQDFNRFVVGMTLDTVPGAKWSYSNEGVQMLALVIEKASGMSTKACFQEMIFDPLGMTSTTLFFDPSGNAATFGGAKTTLRDFYQIARLILEDGMREGKRLLPEGWVGESMTPIEQNPYYGLLWWTDENLGNYTAMGDFGQLCVIYPAEELVYLRYQTCRNTNPSENMNWLGMDFFKMIKEVVKE